VSKSVGVFQLPPGEKAPAGVDRVTIRKVGETDYRIDGALIVAGIIECFAPAPFSSEAAALEAGLGWAKKHRVKIIWVERR
jgi:hypothetical protein